MCEIYDVDVGTPKHINKKVTSSGSESTNSYLFGPDLVAELFRIHSSEYDTTN